MYKKRIKMGGWYEEVWYSHYMIGKCWLILNDENKFECWMNRAYKYRKERAEPIYELTKYFREIGQQIKSYHYYLMGVNIPYPKNDVLQRIKYMKNIYLNMKIQLLIIMYIQMIEYLE